MHIKSLSFMNYKKFKEPTELPLDEFAGRIGILGNNGSGKSTLLDVIPIALFGVEAVTGKKEYLRTHGVDKDMVELRCEFGHHGKEFIIERKFKGGNLTPKASLYEVIDGAVALLATSAKDVTNYIEKILNMNYSIFISTIFCKQKELDKLSDMDPADRRRFILKLSGVDEIEDEIKKCRELKRESDKYVSILVDEVNSKDDVLKEIKLLDDEIASMKQSHKDILKRLAESEETYAYWDNTKKELDEKYEKYNELTLELKDSKAESTYLEKELTKLISEKNEIIELKKYMADEGNSIVDEHSKIICKLEQLDKDRIKYLEKEQNEKYLYKVIEEGKKIKEEREKITKERDSIGFSGEGLDDISKKIASNELEIDELKSEILSATNTLENLKQEEMTYRDEIEKVEFLRTSNDNEDCKCPMCKQEVSKEHVEIVKNHYINKITDIQKYIAEQKNSCSELTKRLEISKNSLCSLKKESDLLREKEAKYAELSTKVNVVTKQHEAKINEYKQIFNESKKYKDLVFSDEEYIQIKENKAKYEEKLKKIHVFLDRIEKLDDIEKKEINIIKSIEKATSKYNSIVQEGKALNFDKNMYSDAKKNYESSYTKHKLIQSETSELKNSIHTKDFTERKFLNAKLDNIKKKEQQYNKHKSLVGDFTIIEQALLNTKNTIMLKINPLINKHLSNIFRTLISEKYDDLVLNKDYSLTVVENGVEYPLTKYSGGEQDICNLSLRLAISKFLAEVHSGAIEFIVLDEIFGSLDDEKKSSLIQVLGGLRYLYKQVFIISHEDVIKSSLDAYITVRENSHKYSELIY